MNLWIIYFSGPQKFVDVLTVSQKENANVCFILRNLSCLMFPVYSYSVAFSNSTLLIAAWLDWQPWSDCSGSCGHGIRARTRKCRIVTDLDSFVRSCIGRSIVTSTCSLEPCPSR